MCQPVQKNLHKKKRARYVVKDDWIDFHVNIISWPLKKDGDWL